MHGLYRVGLLVKEDCYNPLVPTSYTSRSNFFFSSIIDRHPILYIAKLDNLNIGTYSKYLGNLGIYNGYLNNNH